MPAMTAILANPCSPAICSALRMSLPPNPMCWALASPPLSPTLRICPYTWSSRTSAAPVNSGIAPSNPAAAEILRRQKPKITISSGVSNDKKISLAPEERYSLSTSRWSLRSWSLLRTSRQRMQRQRCPISFSRASSTWRRFVTSFPPLMYWFGMSRMTLFNRIQGWTRTFTLRSKLASTSFEYGTCLPSLNHFSMTVHGVTWHG
mmetsp:Transcript_14827/g.29102  ORF Transcript_14827/g.29102 Transcript_14827/m.29102 type:complete len:205 (-) Transcript_14827:1019-1633(-)